MHSNARLLEQLFTALDLRDGNTMAGCYHPDARFRDIAFDLHGKKHISDMWRMICAGDIRATFEVVHADDDTGRVKLVDEYTFADSGRKVRNVIVSEFQFKDNLVIDHRDFCDPREWSAMALGGVSGFLAGRFGVLRSWKATRKLEQFVREHPGHRERA
jgi:ketosteroid isomerase-like protein